MNSRHLFRSCASILNGRTPSLSIEVTRECPLTCPGCYAYQSDHLGGGLRLDQVADFKGQELVDRILRLVDEHKPLHVSLVGGEPLVRFREISALLPALEKRGITTQIVTSAVRPIPPEWRRIRNLNLSVSIDGLQPEHDERRKPATYDRILKHIEGHEVTVHCTITRQMTERPGYFREFLDFWSARPAVRRIWFSIFTPQQEETSREILPRDVRLRVLDELLHLRLDFPKLQLPKSVIEVFRRPPGTPRDCLFARTTKTVSADLKRVITPCQFGGTPDCSQCGCFASAGLGAVGRYRLPIGVRIFTIFEASNRIGQWVAARRAARQARQGSAERDLNPAGGVSI